MGLERLGHRALGDPRRRIRRVGGGEAARDHGPAGSRASEYPAPRGPDGFTVDAEYVKSRLGDRANGDPRYAARRLTSAARSRDEARAGHIPGAVEPAVSRKISARRDSSRPVAELAAAYTALIPSKDTPVIVHCRTGHQASQTFFVLTRLLGLHEREVVRRRLERMVRPARTAGGEVTSPSVEPRRSHEAARARRVDVFGRRSVA